MGMVSNETRLLGSDAHSSSRTKARRLQVVLIILIEVEKVKAVGATHVGTARLRGRDFLLVLYCSRLLDGLGTLIQIPVDLAVFVFPVRMLAFDQVQQKRADHPQPAHHASPSEHSVVDRVGPDVAATAHEIHLDDNQVVDVLKIITECSLSQSRITTTNDQVASGPYADLASHVSRQDKLAIIPADVHLPSVSN